MFLLSRRQVHAALAGAGATLAYLAAAEVGSRKPVRVGGLVVLSSMALAGLMSSKSSVKARNTENRLNGFFNNGGSVGGSFVVNGNHTVTGTVSAGGTISNSSGNINTNGNVNAPGGNVSGGTLTSSGDVQATSGTVHAANVASTGPVSASSTITAGGTISNSSGNINTNGNVNASGAINGGSTTGVGGQGSVLGDKFTDTIPGGGAFTGAAATWLDDFQSAHNAAVGDMQSCVTRVNDLLAALG